MRWVAGWMVVLVPGFAVAQTPETEAAIKARLETLKYVGGLYDSTAGAFKMTADAKPGLRATLAGIRATKYLGGKVSEPEKLTEFVLNCYDPTTGGFAEPGGKPDVATTAVGVMAAVELSIPKTKFPNAMTFLRVNAKTFEDVRIAAAGVEAWGVKEVPFKLVSWFGIASNAYLERLQADNRNGEARDMGSYLAFNLRLGRRQEDEVQGLTKVIHDGQRADGAWEKTGEKTSDLETTYRVMRALYLSKQKPKDVAKLREFLAKCRNADGGYGVAPGAPSNASATYYAAIILKWLE